MPYLILYPEKKTVSDATIEDWFADAVEHSQIHPDFLGAKTVGEKVTALSDAGIITDAGEVAAEFKLKVPTLHLNGTSAEALEKQVRTAYEAVSDAHAVLKEAAPHGRDYYPQGDGVIDVAIEEHVERLRKLETVANELETIYYAIHEQRK